MTTINLKDFYSWYTRDEYIEVSDEVAAELKADKLYEAAHQRRTTRNKAQYSLDCDDGIEYSACLHEPTPQELLDRMELFVHLWNALNSLPEVQGVRVEAHLILGKSYRQIAREQGVDKSAVRHSVKSGKLRRYAEQAGYTIVGVAAEHGSGLTLDRPALQELTEAVLAGKVDVVLVNSLDRLGRDWGMTKQYIDLLTEHKVKLLCVRERVMIDSSSFSPFFT